MTKNPITVDSKTLVLDAQKIMRENKIRRLPVLAKGNLVGIITQHDLLMASPSPATSLSVHELHYLLSKMKVREIMQKNLIEQAGEAVCALYAFCRTVDDIVDESVDEERESRLDYWRGMIETGSFSDNDLVAAAWADTLTRYHIPRHYALQLIDGVNRDIFQARYQTFDELATYCYGVASTVGLMSMYIVGFKNNTAVPYAIKLGVALQMTNILRDVGMTTAMDVSIFRAKN